MDADIEMRCLRQIELWKYFGLNKLVNPILGARGEFDDGCLRLFDACAEDAKLGG